MARVLQTVNLAEQLSTLLADEIKSGRRAPGSQLPTEETLAAESRVSRTVVREAVARLRADGLVVSRQGLGVFVAPTFGAVPFRIAEVGNDAAIGVKDVYELRLGVEAQAASFAAQRASATQLRAIRDALRAVNAAARNGLDGVEEDIAFHRAIGRAANNPLFDRFLSFLELHIREQLANSRRRSTRAGRIFELEDEHDAIYQAIAARDPEAARNASLAHLNRAIGRWADSAGAPA
ncbi:FadR/GntR family transcriptional regulator [Pigmentiphaga soli]|uniref:FadR/GntR family transcriptional regulator n=1 Tax=Pigmentiphaga soli TaxID=1007095 RepID=A0ABP8H371_9BURK